MLILQTGNWVALAATGMNPESIPLTLVVVLRKGVQGVANADWVTVWFFEWNSNSMTSPMEAEMLEGVYVRPLAPTWMVTVAAEAKAGMAARTARTEKRILIVKMVVKV